MQRSPLLPDRDAEISGQLTPQTKLRGPISLQDMLYRVPDHTRRQITCLKQIQEHHPLAFLKLESSRVEDAYMPVRFRPERLQANPILRGPLEHIVHHRGFRWTQRGV